MVESAARRDDLARLHTVVLEAFSEAIGTIRTHEVQLRDLVDERDTYQVWADNVGAACHGVSWEYSLDYRLRKHAILRQQVASFMNVLTYSLKQLASPQVESMIASDCASEEPSDDSASSSSSWGLSDDSNSDEDGESSRRWYRPRASDTTHPELSYAPSSVISKVVRGLCRLPIRQAAGLDRLNHSNPRDLEHFYPFDRLYIEDKFPDLAREVQARFARMIDCRRRLLAYRSAHQRQLNAGIGPHIDSSTAHRHEMLDDPPPALQGEVEQDRRTLPSKATTAKPNPAQELLMAPQKHAQIEGRSDIPAQVETTTIAASEPTKQIEVKVPPRPKDSKGRVESSFVCPYCCTIVTDLNDASWRKHVLDDLKPYVCTRPRCELPEDFFESRNDWKLHEIQDHPRAYRCAVDAHGVFLVEEKFRQHMETEHDLPIDQSCSLMDSFKRPVAANTEEDCHLCGRRTKKLETHLARHLEQVALFAIPRQDYARDDDVDLHQQSQDGEPNSNAAIGRSEKEWLETQAAETFTIDSDVSHSEGHVDFTDVVDTDNVLDHEWKNLEDSQLDIPETTDTQWGMVQTEYSVPEYVGQYSDTIAKLYESRTRVDFRNLSWTDALKESVRNSDIVIVQALLRDKTDHDRRSDIISEILAHEPTVRQRKVFYWLSDYLTLIGSSQKLVSTQIADQDNAKLRKAIVLLEEVLEVQNNERGFISADRLDTVLQLTEAYTADGRTSHAQTLLQTVMLEVERTHPANHPVQLELQEKLAKVLLKDSQTSRAIELLEHVVEVRKALPESHPNRLASQHELAGAYLENDQVQVAIELLEHIVEVKEKTWPESYPDRLASQSELGMAYLDNEQVDRAIPLLEHVLQLQRKVLVDNHPDLLVSEDKLACAYLRKDRASDAIRLLQHVVSVQAKTLPAGDESRMISQDRLVKALQAAGQYEQARDFNRQLVEMRRQVLATDHWSLTQALDLHIVLDQACEKEHKI
ncbi:Hypothetical protein D9617_21g096720 [Elsinoe fawcettii]|nr:Hypothetical protein D9617_21g096720 [Elsinoe fawcettii]